MTNAVQTSANRTGVDTRTEEREQQPVTIPAVDVFENESGITLLADLPGVSHDKLGVRVDGDTLTIEAAASLEGPGNMELLYGEVRYPAYRRSFTLSRELDSARIEASLKDGVLRLSIPKLEEARPRRIEVRAG